MTPGDRRFLLDARWLLTTPGLSGLTGAMAVTVGLMPGNVLEIPWWARMLIGACGAAVLAITAPAAWRWVLNGNRGDTP